MACPSCGDERVWYRGGTRGWVFDTPDGGHDISFCPFCGFQLPAKTSQDEPGASVSENKEKVE
jgi:hypothetical protein